MLQPVTDIRVSPKRMVCDGVGREPSPMLDTLFVLEAEIDGEWRTLCKGERPMTYQNFSDAQAGLRLMRERFGLRRAA
jgi:hypothetical protein